MDPVPDPLLLRKSGSAGNRTRDLCICSQKLWPLDHGGGYNTYWTEFIWRYVCKTEVYSRCQKKATLSLISCNTLFVQTPLFLRILDDYVLFWLRVYQWNDQRCPHKFLAPSAKGPKECDALRTSFCKLVRKSVFWNVLILRRTWDNAYYLKYQPVRYFILSSETSRCNIWRLTFLHHM